MPSGSAASDFSIALPHRTFTTPASSAYALGTTIAASPARTAKLTESGKLRDPEATRWVTWGEELGHLPDARWIAAHVGRDRVVLETSSMTAQIEAVRAGIGAMVVPLPYAKLPGLAPVEHSTKLGKSLAALPEGTLWLVGHRALRDVPRVAVVWAWLKGRFERGQ